MMSADLASLRGVRRLSYEHRSDLIVVRSKGCGIPVSGYLPIAKGQALSLVTAYTDDLRKTHHF